MSFSPVLVSSHTLLINRPGQLLGVGEDVVVVQDHRFDDLIHVRLTGHLVQSVRRGQEGRAEHDGQVPSIHHVLIAVLGEAVGEENRFILNNLADFLPILTPWLIMWSSNLRFPIKQLLKMCVFLINY